MTLILLIGSINYMLQLGYLLTFLVASMAVVGMHNTHSNLAQIVLRCVRSSRFTPATSRPFEINVTNPTTVDRFALRFSFAHAVGADAFSPLFQPAGARPELTDDHDRAAGARFAHRRGAIARAASRAACRRPASTIETRYPFGLWRAWAYLTPALTAMVYPAPEFDAPPLPLTGAGGGDSVGMASSGDDFAGVRPYQPGDAHKMIAWKLAARSDELSVKQFDAAGRRRTDA